VAGKVKHERKPTLGDSDSNIDNVVAFIKAPPAK